MRDTEWVMFNHEWLCVASPRLAAQASGSPRATSHLEGEDTNAWRGQVAWEEGTELEAGHASPPRLESPSIARLEGLDPLGQSPRLPQWEAWRPPQTRATE